MFGADFLNLDRMLKCCRTASFPSVVAFTLLFGSHQSAYAVLPGETPPPKPLNSKQEPKRSQTSEQNGAPEQHKFAFQRGTWIMDPVDMGSVKAFRVILRIDIVGGRVRCDLRGMSTSGSAEQTCEIEGDRTGFTLLSSVVKSTVNGYSPDNFQLRLENATLVGELISAGTAKVVLRKSGSN